ncbi:MAG: UDP-N-acetylmuramate--L-alanine ligase [Anaplasma sp.]
MKGSSGFCAGNVLHFIGIGGIGMSALALFARDCGYVVQGSDNAISPGTLRILQDRGIRVAQDHDASHVQNADTVVYSSAIGRDNVELLAAKMAGKPILHRVDLLARIAHTKRTIVVSGSHGKTTTTGLIAAILEHAGMDPTVFIGGITHSYCNNYKIGQSEWMVVEGDESDARFTKLHGEIVVVTNLEWEHPNNYEHYGALESLFVSFFRDTQRSGIAVLSSTLSNALLQSVECDVMLYGLRDGDVRATDIAYVGDAMFFSVVAQDGTALCRDIRLPLLGEHNVENALAAFAVARSLSIDLNSIKAGLENFQGIGRRFEIIARSKGVTFVDDYAHHPTEIEATRKMAALLATDSSVVGILQPHRFTRIKCFFDDFVCAISRFGYMILTDVYAAGETLISGCESTDVMHAVKSRGFDRVVHENDPQVIAQIIRSVAKPGDVVVAMGAGNITDMVRDIADAHSRP